MLQVTPGAISQWVNDETIPRAETLRRVVEVARLYGWAQQLSDFERMAAEPAEAVSPRGARMRPTVAHYLIGPVREGFLRLLGTLSPADQETALREASEGCLSLLMEGAPSSALRAAPVKTAEPALSQAGFPRLNQSTAVTPLSETV